MVAQVKNLREVGFLNVLSMPKFALKIHFLQPHVIAHVRKCGYAGLP